MKEMLEARLAGCEFGDAPGRMAYRTSFRQGNLWVGEVVPHEDTDPEEWVVVDFLNAVWEPWRVVDCLVVVAGAGTLSVGDEDGLIDGYYAPAEERAPSPDWLIGFGARRERDFPAQAFYQAHGHVLLVARYKRRR